MKNEKLNFVEFGGSRKSQMKADFSGKKDPICSTWYEGGGRGWSLSSFPSHPTPRAQGSGSGRWLATSQGPGGPYRNPTVGFQKVCKCPTPGQHQYCILLQISCKCHILYRKSVKIWWKRVKYPSQIASRCQKPGKSALGKRLSSC